MIKQSQKAKQTTKVLHKKMWRTVLNEERLERHSP
jgi:hypothetical protein